MATNTGILLAIVWAVTLSGGLVVLGALGALTAVRTSASKASPAFRVHPALHWSAQCTVALVPLSANEFTKPASWHMRSAAGAA
jgi:hypothetical protein